MGTKDIAYAEQKSEARLYGIVTAILFAIYLLIPHNAVKGFALFGLYITGWKFFFHGSTVISFFFQGQLNRNYQVTISVLFPIILSLYFIIDVPTVTIKGVLGHMVNLWYLIPFLFIGYSSWKAADYLQKEHPFRGFIIASTIFFVICFMGHHGMVDEYNPYEDAMETVIDKEKAKMATETGRYFGQFFIYVLISYSAMLIKHLKNISQSQASEDDY